MSSDTLYEILNVAPNASPEEIRAAFRRLGAKVHPDKGGSNALFRSVKDAYDTLSDPGRRAQYDRSLMECALAGRAVAYDDRAWVGADVTTGPEPPGWTALRPWPAGAVRVPRRPSFVVQHFGPAVAALGALVIAIFVIAYTVAGPVVFIAPTLLIVVMGLVALVAVRNTEVGDRGRRPPVWPGGADLIQVPRRGSARATERGRGPLNRTRGDR